MANLYRLGIVTMTMLAAGTTFAASILGTWHGKLDFSGMKVPKGADPKMYEQMKASMASLKVDITFKGDKTYTVSSMLPGTKKPQIETGKWTQKGLAISVVDKGHAQNLQLSADGKTLVLLPQGGNGAKMVFKR